MFALTAIRLSLHWLFVVSYRIGEFIICGGITVVQTLATILKALGSFAAIFYEDSTLWLQDVQDFICTTSDAIYDSIDYISRLAACILAAADKCICNICALAVFLMESIQNLLILIGSSCLFLISLPPLLLFYITDMLLYAADESYFFVRSSAKRLACQANEIQTLEMVVGLVVGFGLILLARNVMKLSPWYLRFKTEIRRACRILAKRTWRKARNCLTIVSGQTNNDCKVQETDLCIVCFDETKSICLLPCRHLCLCESCTEALSYPLHCPLCRERANGIMQVYL